jgi:large subunit ribosomal protein L5
MAENKNENENSAPEGAEKPAASAESSAEAKPEAAEKTEAKAEAKGDKGEGKGDKGKAKGEGKGDKGKAKDGKGKPKDGKGKKADSGPAVKYKREQPPRLKRFYEGEVRQKLREEFGYTNPMQIPRVVKISLNMGLGKATQNPKIMDSAVDEMRAISGRTPVVTLAKKDIATFKLRRGHKIGVMVTLRREAMWEFLDRFLNVALPRVRDFRGLSQKAFDGRGNYSIGVKEQIIFPEIEYDSIDAVKGLNVTIVTTAKSDAEGRALLRHLGVPFRQVAGQTETAAQGAQA